MKSAKRDLLVLSRNISTDQREMELEVEKLHDLLFHVESMANFCIANEIIDLNKYKVITSPDKIQKLIVRDRLKPFQFVNNRN